MWRIVSLEKSSVAGVEQDKNTVYHLELTSKTPCHSSEGAQGRCAGALAATEESRKFGIRDPSLRRAACAHFVQDDIFEITSSHDTSLNTVSSIYREAIQEKFNGSHKVFIHDRT
jgi:hypothetical protein